LKYSIDTSILIEGYRDYSPDVLPTLWEKLEELIQKGEVIASEEVLEELKKQDDDVLAWAKKNSMMFKQTDEKVQENVKVILQQFPEITKQNRSSADPFVIALAMVEKCKVVTRERPSNNSKRPKIPDICKALGIQCIDLMDLCREKNVCI